MNSKYQLGTVVHTITIQFPKEYNYVPSRYTVTQLEREVKIVDVVQCKDELYFIAEQIWFLFRYIQKRNQKFNVYKVKHSYACLSKESLVLNNTQAKVLYFRVFSVCDLLDLLHQFKSIYLSAIIKSVYGQMIALPTNDSLLQITKINNQINRSLQANTECKNEINNEIKNETNKKYINKSQNQEDTSKLLFLVEESKKVDQHKFINNSNNQNAVQKQIQSQLCNQFIKCNEFVQFNESIQFNEFIKCNESIQFNQFIKANKADEFEKPIPAKVIVMCD